MSKSYLSWDVGIRNLAFCLIKNVDNSKFEIIKWGVINLGDPIKTCCELNKNKKPCTGAVKFQSNEKYYCEKHIKIIQNIQNKENEQNDMMKLEKNQNNKQNKCKYMVKDHECGKKSTYYFTDINITYCKAHALLYQKQKNTKITKLTKKNSNKIPVQTLAINLFDELNKVPEFLTVNEVLIENQPTLKNPTMKTISMLLYSYFVMKGLIVNKDPNSIIENIKLICPSNKLKVSSDANKKVKLEEDKKKSYIITKTLAVKFCTELIKTDAANLALINGMKKKDDMCDAFLQGYYYIFCSKGVPKDVEQILNNIVKDDDKQNKSDKNDKNKEIDLSTLR